MRTRESSRSEERRREIRSVACVRLTCDAMFPSSFSAVTSAVRYAGPSLDDRSLASAAASGDDAPPPEEVSPTAAAVVGKVTDAPAAVAAVAASEVPVAAAPPPTEPLSPAVSFPMTWTTLPSSSLNSPATSPAALSEMTLPRKINFSDARGTDVASDALRRSSDAVRTALPSSAFSRVPLAYPPAPAAAPLGNPFVPVRSRVPLRVPTSCDFPAFLLIFDSSLHSSLQSSLLSSSSVSFSSLDAFRRSKKSFFSSTLALLLSKNLCSCSRWISSSSVSSLARRRRIDAAICAGLTRPSPRCGSRAPSPTRPIAPSRRRPSRTLQRPPRTRRPHDGLSSSAAVSGTRAGLLGADRG